MSVIELILLDYSEDENEKTFYLIGIFTDKPNKKDTDIILNYIKEYGLMIDGDLRISENDLKNIDEFKNIDFIECEEYPEYMKLIILKK